MITGSVLQRQACVGVILRLPQQGDLEIEFVVDTGFAGFLTLPPSAVSALGLPFRETIAANLASDEEIQVDSYRAVILWHGAEREIDVLALGRRPLLGTALLDGYELVAQFADGGLVTIDNL